MFGIRYFTGTIRPNNWYPGLKNNKIEHFIQRNDFSHIVAVPKDYINNWEILRANMKIEGKCHQCKRWVDLKPSKQYPDNWICVNCCATILRIASQSAKPDQPSHSCDIMECDPEGMKAKQPKVKYYSTSEVGRMSRKVRIMAARAIMDMEL